MSSKERLRNEMAAGFVFETSDLLAIFEMIPSAVLVILPDAPVFTMVGASEAYLRLSGVKREDLLGKGLFEVFPDSAKNLADGKWSLRESLRRTLATGAADNLPTQRYDVERPEEAGGGFEERYWNALNTPVRGAEGCIQYILHSVEEVTERVMAERQAEADLKGRKQGEQDAFLVRLNDAMGALTDPDEILKAAAAMVGEHLGVDRCAYATFENDEGTVDIATEYVGPGVRRLGGRHATVQLGAKLLANLRANAPFVVDEMEHDLRMPDVREGYRRGGIEALVAVPLVKGGHLLALWSVQQQRPRKWQPAEVELVKQAANRCWESIERARAAREWQASEQRLRLAQRAGRSGSFEWQMKLNLLIWTPEMEALYGIPEGSFEGRFEDWTRRVAADDLGTITTGLEQCVAQQKAECVFEFRAVLPDGSQRWLLGQGQISYDAGGAAERLIGVNIDIDARKQAESHLRESEERLRGIFDGTYEYIGLMSPDGTLLEANRASLEFAGNPRQDVVGRRFWDIPWFAGTAGAPERVEQAVARAAAGEFVRFEATVRRPSGECPTFDISFHPVRNERGEVVFIVPEGRDITEHKERKEQLQQQWHLFDTALSHTPDHTYIFDLQGRFRYANRALLRLWNKPLEEAIGKNASELNYPAELADQIQRHIQRVIETKEPVRDQTAFAGASGDLRHFDYIFVPVFDAEGSVEAVAGSTRDITDRERMERALTVNEEKLQRVFAQAPVAIVAFRGRDFVVEMANPTYRALLQGRELVGHRFAEVVPELGQDVWDAFNYVFDTGEPFIANEWLIPYDYDIDGISEDHWFNVAYNPLRDADGTVSGLIAVMTDVTVQVLARRELERVNRELEEFSYVASHDLQEPLRMVNVYAHLMLRRIGPADATMSQYASFVRQGVTRMETLLSDLLKFSRAVHAQDLPAGDADLSVCLNEALEVLRTHVDESSAVIKAAPLPTVKGDPEQLAHVFQNLLSNALKYRKKDMAPVIEIEAARQGADWTIAVRDNGIGFDPQYSEKIFGLFKRLHREEYPGTGLGLAICQRIVGRYGGRMWAEGRLGEGSVFRFSLPGAADNLSDSNSVS